MRKRKRTVRRAAVLMAGILFASSVSPAAPMAIGRVLAAEREEKILEGKEHGDQSENLATPSTPSVPQQVVDKPKTALAEAETEGKVDLSFSILSVTENTEEKGQYDIALNVFYHCTGSYQEKTLYAKFDITYEGKSVLENDLTATLYRMEDDGHEGEWGTQYISKQFTVSLPKKGIYEISAVVSENKQFDTLIEDVQVEKKSFLRPESYSAGMQVQTVYGKNYLLSATYVDATILLFGGSRCYYCQNTLKNLNGLLNSGYNRGDVRIIFADISDIVPLEETKKLAATLPNIDVCKEMGGYYHKHLEEFTQKAGDEERGGQFPYVFILDQDGEITYSSVSGGAILERSVFERELGKMGIVPLSKRKEEIKKYYDTHKFDTSLKITYDQKPQYQPNAYAAGKLSAASTQDGLNALNFVRYLAGLSEVTINEDYQDSAQKGAVIMKAVNEMTHEPLKPADMQQDFFDKGRYEGTERSNIGKGYRNLSEDIINGWMNDGDERNIDRVGHRRWCLNPAMSQTGFGYADTYSAMYAHDEGGVQDQAYVPWPAQVMPSEYFKGPWSVSLNDEIFEQPDDSKVTVTMKAGGKTYTFSKADQSQGFFNISNDAMGMGPAIIINPKSIGTGSAVDVTVNGLVNKNGEEVELRYSVEFFTMKNNISGGGGGSSSGGGGGSSSGGGGGSSSGGGGGSSKGSSTGPAGSPAAGSLPSYVVQGTWIEGAGGIWTFMDKTGLVYANRWAAVYNPYANVSAGAQAFDWFRFDEKGQMVTGWYQDPVDGKTYYLSPVSDGTKGKMVTGWVTIDGKEYYFNPVSDGFRGRLFRNEATPDGHFVDENGVKKY